MLRVLLVLENDISNTGGIERHCSNIVDLFKNDLTIEIDYLCKERILYRYDKVIQKEIWNHKQLCEILKKYDVIHVHGFAAFYVGQTLKIAVKLNKRIIYTSHYHPFVMLRRPTLGRLFFKMFIHQYLGKIDTIISINLEDKAFFEKYNKNVVMIPNWLTGIEEVVVKRCSNMILAVGRNDFNKGLYHLNKIPMDDYEVHCITNSSEGLDSRIIIHSGIDDKELSLLYSKASLLVIPSRYEAFSYVALEALERGTPVLMTERVRIYDHIKGINGVEIFKFDDMLDFVSKIRTSINSNVDIKYIKDLFSQDKVRNKLKSIYLDE